MTDDFEQTNDKKNKSAFSKLKSQFKHIFSALPSTSMNESKLEFLAKLVHSAMTSEKRFYHNTDHLFEILSSQDPVVSLSILFHDVVYIQVDQNSESGFPDQTLRQLTPLIPDANYQLQLPDPDSLPHAPEVKALYQVFSVEAGHQFNSSNGLNEFLSARVAQTALGDVLSYWDLLTVMAGIELTIPFRGTDKEGLTAPERIYRRLSEINQCASPPIESFQIKQRVRKAIQVSNSDLSGFAAESPVLFLTNSLKLILEANPSLEKGHHSPREIRLALEKMNGFFKTLEPRKIFLRFEDHPSEQEFSQLVSRCEFNLSSGRAYLSAKILALGVLEAGLSFSKDRHCNLVESKESLLPHGERSNSIIRFLDESLPEVTPNETNSEVCHLLEVLDRKALGFELDISLFSLYLYRRLKSSEFNHLNQSIVLFFKGERSALQFLSEFPKSLLTVLVQAFSEIIQSKTNEFDDLKILLS